MQPKEQKVILLEDQPAQDEYLPAQDEYEMAQPKVRTSSRRSGSKLSRGPLGRTGPQTIAGTATTLTVARELRGPGQRGHDSYQKADGPTEGEHPTDQTSSADIGGQENPIDDAERDTSESHDVKLFRLSVADAASMACASGEDPPAMAKDDQDAGSSRAVDSD